MIRNMPDLSLAKKMALLTALTLLGGCATGGSSSRPSDDVKNEVSLKADRSSLAELRKDISDTQKDQNDYTALVLKDMGELKYSPQEVRDRFYTQTRKTREKFNDQQRKAREKYNTQERKNREKFLADLKKERTQFIANKPKPDDSRGFFQDQENRRSAYFQDQTDKRKDFESEMKQIRDDFNEDMNLKQKQFDDAYREYYKNYQEAQKQKEKIEKAKEQAHEDARNAQTKQEANSSRAPRVDTSYPGQDRDMQDFNRSSGSAQPLGTDDSNGN